MKHIKSERKRKAEKASTKNLLTTGKDSSDDEDSAEAESIWLIITTKTHVIDKKRLKPGKISLPHSLNRSSSAAVCLITPDPQRSYKDIISHPSFPSSLASQIRVLGLSKIKARYKSFESRRQLVAQYDVFLADERVIPLLAPLLGKAIYASSKRPVPVRLEAERPKDDSGKHVKAPKSADGKAALGTPASVAREIEKALSSARVQLAPSTTTAVRIGYSNFSPEELADNVAAVVDGMQARFITKGWRNIRGLHIKGPNTTALPIWAADELWVNDEAVVDDKEAEELNAIGTQKGRKRKERVGEEEDTGEQGMKTKKVKSDSVNGAEGKIVRSVSVDDGEEKTKKTKTIEVAKDDGFSKEMAGRREALRKQKREALAKEEQGKVSSKAEPDGGVKVKVKKMKRKTIPAAA